MSCKSKANVVFFTDLSLFLSDFIRQEHTKKGQSENINEE